MNITGNTILITGGATGIGFCLAEALIKHNNTVIICGRRQDKLDEAKSKLPEAHYIQWDVSDRTMAKEMVSKLIAQFPQLNMLINNAGMQYEVDFTQGENDLKGLEELNINLEAPMRLSALFIPHLRTLPSAAIMNVSSGLGFVPLSIMPVYCATKAALHSFSLSLRHQLKNTSIKVFEMIPPIVDTELDRGARDARGMKDRGISPELMAQVTLEGMEKDEMEIAHGFSKMSLSAAQVAFGEAFKRMNP
jgi:uncharacterized oxidoreductase